MYRIIDIPLTFDSICKITYQFLESHFTVKTRNILNNDLIQHRSHMGDKYLVAFKGFSDS